MIFFRRRRHTSQDNTATYKIPNYADFLIFQVTSPKIPNSLFSPVPAGNRMLFEQQGKRGNSCFTSTVKLHLFAGCVPISCMHHI